MAAYYNEIDPYAAQWLRNLIAAGHIASGDVDERSIINVEATDLKGYTQHHFFAGIGGWSYALRLAMWPDNRPVWTGSCPCQPFSSAGSQKGHGDERHLWPHWFRLIRECHPSTIFGEQVAGAITFGWLDAIFNDLEKQAYACASAVLPALSIGAPHKRDRLWFMANANGGRCSKSQVLSEQPRRTEAFGSGEALAHSSCRIKQTSGSQCDFWGFQKEILRKSQYTHDFGIEPSVGRVADGISARSHKLRAYGNAIVPQVAAEFIKASGLI